MILLNVFIGFFAIFISPQIFLYYRYNNLHYSLIVTYGIILSFTGAWFISLAVYYLDLPNIFVYSLASFIDIMSIVYIFLHQESQINRKNNFLIWILAFSIMLPLLHHIGMGFSVWDVLASWNTWAMQLFNNDYFPIDAAYPVLMPTIWSLIYKIQGTNEIWWTAQITLFVLPVMTLVILLSLFNEMKNKSYLLMVLFIYPYLISIHTINGNMDMSVMIMGTLSIVLLYTAELYKNKVEFEYYIYAALLLAGIASIIKQPGLAFILFAITYIILNIKYFNNRKRLILIIGITLLYFISYLSLYYQNNIASPTGNFSHLGNLSQQKLAEYKLPQYLEWLYARYFQLPASLPFFEPLLALAKIKLVTPLLIVLGLMLFIFKDLRKYTSVTFLSALYFILATLIWIKFFSYDERNALWVKSFLILFLSINLNYLITQYTHKPIYTKVLLSVGILGISIYLFSLGDKFTYEMQKNSQMQAGARYGCMPSIKYAAKLLKDKKPCVKVYTNELPMPQNYLLNAYKDKFILMGRDYKYQHFGYLTHNCEAGRYIIFRKNSMSHRQEWSKVTKLVEDGIIKRMSDQSVLAYFVPANIKIADDYFARTDIVNIKLSPPRKNIKYALDKFKEDTMSYIFTGWAFVENVQTDQTKKYLLLKNEQHTYIVRMRAQKRPDVTKNFKVKNLDNSGFSSYIYKEDFQKGTYDVRILLIDNNDTQYQVSLNKKITI